MQQYDTNNVQQNQTASNSNGNNKKNQKPQKRSNALEDNLALAAFFLVLGIVFHSFASDTHTMNLDGFYQSLSYVSYAISVIGALSGLADKTKKDYLSLGVGIGFGVVAYWLHSLVFAVQNIAWLATLLEAIYALFICAAFYGIVKGLINVLASPKSENPSLEPKKLPTGEKWKRVISIILIILPLLLSFIQALPIILQYIQDFLPH